MGYVSQIFAAKGVAPLYNKLGFVALPDEAPGMKFIPNSR